MGYQVNPGKRLWCREAHTVVSVSATNLIGPTMGEWTTSLIAACNGQRGTVAYAGGQSGQPGLPRSPGPGCVATALLCQWLITPPLLNHAPERFLHFSLLTRTCAPPPTHARTHKRTHAYTLITITVRLDWGKAQRQSPLRTIPLKDPGPRSLIVLFRSL